MTLETFVAKTSLKLLDGDGGLKPSDDLPPIHTFLNRLLALRIADQNALFADFDRILSGILDRAAASGELDRGLEDIEAEELEVTDQEVIRTDVSTGAETALVTFSLKVRREILVADAFATGGLFDAVVAADDASADPVDAELLALKRSGDWSAFFKLAVVSRRNILVSGATGSGKTTFAKGLVEAIPDHERLLTIEDTRELVVPLR